MPKGRRKNYFCTVTSENVEITLKRKSKTIFESRGMLFVQCNQSDCQYSDINQLPCPLNVDLFEGSSE